MLRVHCVQLFCNLSDPAMEDMLVRPRAPSALPGESVEDSGRDDDLDFRRRLERHGLAHLLFQEIRDRLAKRGGSC